MLVQDRVKFQFRRRVRSMRMIPQPAGTRLTDFFVVVFASIAASLGVQFAFGAGTNAPDEIVWFALAVGALFLGTNELRGFYKFESLGSLSEQVQGLLSSWLAIWAALAVLAFAMRASTDFSRLEIAALVVVDAVALVAARASLHRYYVSTRDRLRRERIALLRVGGSDPNTLLYRQATVIHSAIVDLNQSVDFDSFVREARARHATKVVISMPPDRLGDAMTFVERFRGLPLPIYVVTEDWLSDTLARPRVLGNSIPAFEIRSAPLSLLERAMKRGLDISVAGLSLLMLSPLMLMVALLVRLESPGPILFRQRRLGFNGREFRILKFRSMTVTEDGDKIVQASRDDKRVTRVGAIIRATSVDELPQLINVLAGEMSLVGPRPHAVAHDNTYEDIIADYSLRRHMKPGLTGWAQVNGLRGETRSVELMERRVEHDLWYIDNWSIWLDLKILAMTAIELFRNRNVY